MKKICFVTTIFMTYKSFLLELTKYLHETGEYEISLICNKEDNIKEILPDYVRYYPIKMERGISLSLISSIKQIYNILKKNKFDIVQYSTPNASFYTAVASKLAKVPVRLYCQWGIRYMGFEGVKRNIFKLLEYITCKFSTHIEVESHSIQNFSVSENLYVKQKSKVIWNGSACGVNLEKFDISKRKIWRDAKKSELDINKTDIVYIYAARLTADKGINELLSAFLDLSKSYSNIKLLVLGGMDNKDSLEMSVFNEAKNSDSVIFTGNVDNIQEFYAAGDVFVSPSYREGFGLVVIEAGAMGLPAIVTNVPGQIDAIVPNITGLTCELKDVFTLKNAMQVFADNQHLIKTMSESAHAFVVESFEQKKLFEYLKQSRDEYIQGGN